MILKHKLPCEFWSFAGCRKMKVKRTGMIIIGPVLIILSIYLLATSPWVQHYTYVHILFFSIGVGVLVYGLIPSWWR